jgi:FlgD Ig-like domain
MKTFTFILILLAMNGFAQVTSEVLWEKTFGGNLKDGANSIQETNDGGYIMTGYSTSYSLGSYDIWLVKTDAEGNEQWNKTFGTEFQDIADIVRQTSDGGYIIGGYKGYDFQTSDSWNLYLIKTDANGVEEWSKFYENTSFQGTNSLIELPEGGYIVGAYDYSEGNINFSDASYIRLNAQGEELWKVTEGQLGFDIVWDIKLASDGGIIFAGVTSTYENSLRDVMLIKRDKDGNEIWNRKIDIEETDERGFSIDLTDDNGFVITGFKVDPNSGNKDAILIKTDSDGIVKWTKEYAKENQSFDFVRSVITTSDNGYAIIGCVLQTSGNYNTILIKTDSQGNEKWYTYYSKGISAELGEFVTEININEYVIGGTITTSNTDSDMYLAKIKVESTTDVEYIEDVVSSTSTCYPNPFKESVDIEIRINNYGNVNFNIYDITGKKIKSILKNNLSEGNYSFSWDGKNNNGCVMKPGTYFCEILIEENREVIKLQKLN